MSCNLYMLSSGIPEEEMYQKWFSIITLHFNPVSSSYLVHSQQKQCISKNDQKHSTEKHTLLFQNKRISYLNLTTTGYFFKNVPMKGKVMWQWSQGSLIICVLVKILFLPITKNSSKVLESAPWCLTALHSRGREQNLTQESLIST